MPFRGGDNKAAFLALGLAFVPLLLAGPGRARAGPTEADPLEALPALAETIDVRVVNVDVVVTDAFGNPVTGLEKDDFELLVGGRPTDVAYFSAIDDRDGTEPGGSRAGVVEIASRDQEQRPFLVILIDGRSLLPGEGRATFDQLIEQSGSWSEPPAVSWLRATAGACAWARALPVIPRRCAKPSIDSVARRCP